MLLDIWLEVDEKVTRESSSRIFIRRDGSTVEISREEWDRLHPGVKPSVVIQYGETNEVYSANITHNLGKMADECGVYIPLWRPEELNIIKAKQLVGYLSDGLVKLTGNPAYYKKFNPENGWGNYYNLIGFVAKLLNACNEYPDANVRISR